VAGRLYVVGTPIGNLEDITLRALRILGEVEAIACEDTRQTVKLLNRYGLQKPLISYFHPREGRRIPEIIRLLKEGRMSRSSPTRERPASPIPGSLSSARRSRKAFLSSRSPAPRP
jgi:16S rRNA (cytidine1402-2'-O)-methyltransferase